MASLKDKQSGDPNCPICEGDGEIVVSQEERGLSNFLGHNTEPCPICCEGDSNERD
jgi:hypothetical protein